MPRSQTRPKLHPPIARPLRTLPLFCDGQAGSRRFIKRLTQFNRRRCQCYNPQNSRLGGRCPNNKKYGSSGHHPRGSEVRNRRRTIKTLSTYCGESSFRSGHDWSSSSGRGGSNSSSKRYSSLGRALRRGIIQLRRHTRCMNPGSARKDQSMWLTREDGRIRSPVLSLPTQAPHAFRLSRSRRRERRPLRSDMATTQFDMRMMKAPAQRSAAGRR
mmetsp:Transcript_123175/g.353892  ORF Transcript_123175/g.353892 Transcript_123175/m.353892 type:complete len:215 (-) Transcript_123175:450-1094(-)